MNRVLVLRNRQRTVRVNMRLLRRLALGLLLEKFHASEFELGIHLVNADEMTRLNEHFLHHQGPTDVITFNYADPHQEAPHGEIYICPDEALAQARKFRTTWVSELVRYVIHGLLHLHNYNDTDAAARKLMKREEKQLLKEVSREYPLDQLARAK